MPAPDLTAAATVVSSSFAAIIVGTAGADRISVDGGTAIGNGGDDVFVLTSKGATGAAPEYLGMILDFNAGDTLDLSKLGEHAAIVGREAQDGGERVSIDFNGDGKADGIVTVANGAFTPFPGDGEVAPTHEPPTLIPPADGGGFVVLPVEWDGGNGSTPIPVEPDGGNGSTPIPVEPDGGIGSTPDGFVTLPIVIDLGRLVADIAAMDAARHTGFDFTANWIA